MVARMDVEKSGGIWASVLLSANRVFISRSGLPVCSTWCYIINQGDAAWGFIRPDGLIVGRANKD